MSSASIVVVDSHGDRFSTYLCEDKWDVALALKLVHVDGVDNPELPVTVNVIDGVDMVGAAW